VEYLNADGQVIIDYIRADMIYPLSWDNGDITECAFGTAKMLNGKYFPALIATFSLSNKFAQSSQTVLAIPNL